MGCETGFDMWDPIPSGSQFCGKITAFEGDDFFINVRIAPASGTATTIGTSALLNGTCIPLEDRGYGVIATVRIGAEAATVNLRLYLEGPNGDVLFECLTQHSTINSTSNVALALVPA